MSSGWAKSTTTYYGMVSYNHELEKKDKSDIVGLARGEMYNIDALALDVFGEMRNATSEENESVRRYIDSISENTGVNFFDFV